MPLLLFMWILKNLFRVTATHDVNGNSSSRFNALFSGSHSHMTSHQIHPIIKRLTFMHMDIFHTHNGFKINEFQTNLSMIKTHIVILSPLHTVVHPSGLRLCLLPCFNKSKAQIYEKQNKLNSELILHFNHDLEYIYIYISIWTGGWTKSLPYITVCSYMIINAEGQGTEVNGNVMND